jgi:hypothetical protein
LGGLLGDEIIKLSNCQIGKLRIKKNELEDWGDGGGKKIKGSVD